MEMKLKTNDSKKNWLGGGRFFSSGSKRQIFSPKTDTSVSLKLPTLPKTSSTPIKSNVMAD